MPDAKRKNQLGAKSQWKEKQEEEGIRGGIIEYLYFSRKYSIGKFLYKRREFWRDILCPAPYLPTYLLREKEREMLSFLNKANKCQPYKRSLDNLFTSKYQIPRRGIIVKNLCVYIIGWWEMYLLRTFFLWVALSVTIEILSGKTSKESQCFKRTGLIPTPKPCSCEARQGEKGAIERHGPRRRRRRRRPVPLLPSVGRRRRRPHPLRRQRTEVCVRVFNIFHWMDLNQIWYGPPPGPCG